MYNVNKYTIYAECTQFICNLYIIYVEIYV